jgi:hypothetical protein
MAGKSGPVRPSFTGWVGTRFQEVSFDAQRFWHAGQKKVER